MKNPQTATIIRWCLIGAGIVMGVITYQSCTAYKPNPNLEIMPTSFVGTRTFKSTNDVRSKLADEYPDYNVHSVVFERYIMDETGTPYIKWNFVVRKKTPQEIQKLLDE